MIRMMTTMLPIALLALGGCVQQWRPAAPIAGPCAVTEAARMRYAGVDFHDVRRAELQRATNARIARVLRPGDGATMDFREDRLNIVLDDGGLISGLRCG